MLPGSAVPWSSGFESSVLDRDVIRGALGAVMSTPIGNSAARLVLPAGSVTVTLIMWLPSSNGVAGVQLQLPAPSTIAVHSVVAPSVTVTVLPGSAVPAKAGVSSADVPATGVLIVGAPGAVVSTV